MHKQAPVHESRRLMSELMANPNGHLQVISVIHGCQLTSHLNNYGLWNTNQNIPPWRTDYFILLNLRILWRTMTTKKKEKRGRAGFASLPSRRRVTHYARDRQLLGVIRCRPDRCVFLFSPLLWCDARGPNESHVGDPVSHLDRLRFAFPCSGPTNGCFSCSGKATRCLNDVPEYYSTVILSPVKTS